MHVVLVVHPASHCPPSFIVCFVVPAIFVPRLLVVGSCVFSFVIQIDIWFSHRWSVCSLVDRCSSSSRVGSRVVDVGSRVRTLVRS